MLSLASIVGASFVSSTSLAQTAPQDRSFSPQMFHPAPGNDTFVSVESAAPLKHKQWAVGLFFDYARDPFTILSYDNASGGTTSASAEKAARADIISARIATEIWAAIGLFDRFQIALSLPMTLYQTGRDFTSTNPAPDGTTIPAAHGFALGDPRIYLKARLVGKERGFQLALSHWLGVPVGNDTQFGGEKNFAGFDGEGRILGGYDGERLHVGAFVGFHWRAHTSHFFSTTIGQQITYGGAASYAIIKRWLTLVAELYGFHDFSTNINAGPLALDLAAKVGVYPGLSLNVGVGNGLIAGFGSPQPHIYVGAVYSPDNLDRDHDGVPDARDKCPDVPEDRDGFQDKDGCPDPDNDGDTILDREDKCPDAKEDFDNFQDDDGCPDPDNDGDGILDEKDPCPNAAEDHKPPKPNDGCPASQTDSDNDGVTDDKDKCPNEAEDKDGFQDDDGCIDPDNDNDGIPDEFDQCPNAAEDMDGFKDDDGCPDPDNDNDGILDKDDKCPNEPETINGYKDEDGCPDTGPPSKVKVEHGQIIILDKVFFDTAKARIQPKSFNLLDQVALTIKAHPEFKIRVEGYTDAQGNLDSNVKLSQERADAVRAYIVGKGIDAARLTSVGYGSAQPIADNKTAKGREANRRVEFHIIDEPKPQKPAADDAKPDEQ